LIKAVQSQDIMERDQAFEFVHIASTDDVYSRAPIGVTTNKRFLVSRVIRTGYDV